MEPKTAELWAKQDHHEGDRRRLFSTVAAAIETSTVLYPGCYVDVHDGTAEAEVRFAHADYTSDLDAGGGDRLVGPETKH